MSEPLGLGSQYVIEIEGCSAELLSRVEEVEAAMRGAAKAMQATILSGHFHQFEPHGVSGALIISESHFAVHTWPEHGYAAVDLFTCGPKRLDPQAGAAYLAAAWGGSVAKLETLVRGPGVG